MVLFWTKIRIITAISEWQFIMRSRPTALVTFTIALSAKSFYPFSAWYFKAFFLANTAFWNLLFHFRPKVEQWNVCGPSSLTAPKLRRYRLRAEMATESPISGVQRSLSPPGWYDEVRGGEARLGDDYRWWLHSYVLICPSFGRVVRVGALPDWQREQAHMETESESE